MSCKQENKRLSTIKRMRELARKSAIMEGCVYVLFEKKNGTFGFAKEGDKFEGKLEEYIYP